MLIISSMPGCYGELVGAVLFRLIPPSTASDYTNLIPKSLWIRSSDHNSSNELVKCLNEKKDCRFIVNDSEDNIISTTAKKWCIENKLQPKEIFIISQNRQIERRLNDLKSFPEKNRQINKQAITHEFLNYKVPIALSEAKRMMYLQKENEVNYKDNNNILQFEFDWFFDHDTWISKMLSISDSLGLTHYEKELSTWFRCLDSALFDIKDKTKSINKSIEEKKFPREFNDNEKGIVLGSIAAMKGDFDEDDIQTDYFHFTRY